MTCLSAYMYRQISKCTDRTPKKHYWGSNCPPVPPLATLMGGGGGWGAGIVCEQCFAPCPLSRLNVAPCLRVHPQNVTFIEKRTCSLKVLGISVGLCKTTKRKDQLYFSLLVSVWRIICENFNPNRFRLAEIIMNENLNKENKNNSGF